MRTLFVVAALLVAVPFSSAQAQAKAAAKPQMTVGQAIDAEITSIKQRIKLTPDQEDKLRAYLDQAAADYDKLEDEYDKKDDAITAKYRKKMRAVLSPEQQAEWDKIKSEYRAMLSDD
jgi:Spy/CpxP family protein refolding chaperone